MDETTTIRNITILETAKNKRSYRRGQITKLKTRLEELKTYSLRDTKLKELHLVKQELQRETELHCALQSQYEALLASKAKNEELAEEECSGEDIKYQHRQLMQQLCDLIERFQFYQEALSIREDFDFLEKISDITKRVFEKAFSKLTSRVSSFQHDTLEYRDDEHIQPLCKSFKDSVEKYLVNLSTAQSKEKDTAKDKSASWVIHTSTKEHTKFDLELPTFSGKPTDWRAFFDLFSSTLETRGKHLNDKEKRCLLLKAMKSEDAKDTVLVHSQGEDGYDKAVEALINNYGSAMIVYPHYVRNLTTRETYTYDRESLQRMRQQFLLNYEALKAF